MQSTIWWKQPLRMIQYNLQTKDTGGMIPEKIATDLEDSNANAVIINVGGIYAWYPSKVNYHHINEYLPANRDLLKELIDCCHIKGIQVIARFDFSKTEDYTYLTHPEWFVKDIHGKPVIYGKERMGNWSLLVSTCINGGYRNEEVATKVLREVLLNYDIDGVFFNAPHMETCFCEKCQDKYQRLYHEELPQNAKDFDISWRSRCLKDNMSILYQEVKSVKEEIPVILYYDSHRISKDQFIERLPDRFETADLICTEAQDILSLGKNKLPAKWKPTINMKLGQRIDNRPKPCGIIHSCPGMDWRHTGLPVAEYEFWMSQIPAAGGQLWHSLTGYQDTIQDKRILDVVKKVNQKVKIVSDYMEEAKLEAEVLLLLSSSESERGLIDGMMTKGIQYDVKDPLDLSSNELLLYPVVLLPNDLIFDDKLLKMLEEYVLQGGNLIIEKTNRKELTKISSLLGIQDQATELVDVVAAYGIMETTDNKMIQGLSETKYIPVKGNILATKRCQNTDMLMSYIPPFAPPDAVGAPPERASIIVSQTDIPLITVREMGNGRVMGIFFELSILNNTYRLKDHRELLNNCIKFMVGEKEKADFSELPDDVYVYAYRNKANRMIHLVNGIGERPLNQNISCQNISFKYFIGKESKVSNVISVLDNQELTWEKDNQWITIHLKQLNVWDMILIELERRDLR